MALASSHTGEATVPTTVTIAANQAVAGAQANFLRAVAQSPGAPEQVLV